MRDKINFFSSYYEGLMRLNGEEFEVVAKALLRYMFEDVEPSGLSYWQEALFIAWKTSVDFSKKQMDDGRKGGTKRGENYLAREESRLNEEDEAPLQKAGSGVRKKNKHPSKSSEPPLKTFATTLQEKDEAIDIDIDKDIDVEEDIDVERDIDVEEDIIDSCSEPKNCSEPEPEIEPVEPVICLPLNDGTEFPISEEQCHEWAGLYPAVDAIQQLRQMRGWLLANPTKRKTRRGILRFINSWLAREQDKYHGAPLRNGTQRASPQSTLNDWMALNVEEVL